MNAKNERATDIAKKKGYQHLIQVLTPHSTILGNIELLYFPDNITEAQPICALRFQGYKYEQSLGSSANGGTGQGLANLIAPVAEELTLHGSNDDNFAAFFGLQRFLHKWGGEYLTGV